MRLPPSAIVSDQHIEIVEVVSKSAAQNAGLQQGDQIVTINGQVPNHAEASRAILADQTEKGFELTLEIKRDGTMQTVHAKPEFWKPSGNQAWALRLRISERCAFRCTLRSCRA
jgi:C-terminal processing protease CtpA/Prc